MGKGRSGQVFCPTDFFAIMSSQSPTFLKYIKLTDLKHYSSIIVKGLVGVTVDALDQLILTVFFSPFLKCVWFFFSYEDFVFFTPFCKAGCCRCHPGPYWGRAHFCRSGQKHATKPVCRGRCSCRPK